MTIALPSLATACDRTKVSNSLAAVFETSVLPDVGIVSPINLRKVIDQSKIRRKRRKTRNKLHQNNTCIGMERLLFDGCKDKTLTHVFGQDKKYQRKTLSEEHISIVAEPNAFILVTQLQTPVSAKILLTKNSQV